MNAILVFLITIGFTHCTPNRSALTSNSCAELSEACNKKTLCCSGMVCTNITTSGAVTSDHCELKLAVRYINLKIKGAKNVDLDVDTDTSNDVDVDIDTLDNNDGRRSNSNRKRGKNCRRKRKN
uniref:WAP domain-containing protein n=1 Tax=Graphocephala atropunctata TaxID=36148 RepID=A0A1B6L616_9HEMI